MLALPSDSFIGTNLYHHALRATHRKGKQVQENSSFLKKEPKNF
jgi:hypothetical protein